MLAFFSMVDRRKRLHRDIAEQLPVGRADLAATAIPALAVIERMAVEREPVPVFAPRSPATRAYRELWAEIRGARLPRELPAALESDSLHFRVLTRC